MTEATVSPDAVRDYVRQWIADERDYTLNKYGMENDDRNTLERPFDHWPGSVADRFHRAQLLGLETEVGRQAFAKAVSTAVMGLEAVVRNYGPLPEPGVTSGDNLNEIRPL